MKGMQERLTKEEIRGIRCLKRKRRERGKQRERKRDREG